MGDIKITKKTAQRIEKLGFKLENFVREAIEEKLQQS